MTKKGEPVITGCKAGENWTCVTFYPDLQKFGMECLEEETVQLMRKRVYDLAGILGKSCKVCELWAERGAACSPRCHGCHGACTVVGTAGRPACRRPPRCLQVFLNKERLGIKSFSDYVDMYLGPKDTGPPRVYERVNDRWEVVVSPTDGQFQQVGAGSGRSSVPPPPMLHGRERVGHGVPRCTRAQVSFVNSICTSKGGTHVTYVVDQITK